MPILTWAITSLEVSSANAPKGTWRPSSCSAGDSRSSSRVEVGSGGDVVSVRDRRENRELLAGPLRLQLLRDEPFRWPAWEVDYADLTASSKAVVSGPVRIRVVESGPARLIFRMYSSCRVCKAAQATLCLPTII